MNDQTATKKKRPTVSRMASRDIFRNFFSISKSSWVVVWACLTISAFSERIFSFWATTEKILNRICDEQNRNFHKSQFSFLPEWQKRIRWRRWTVFLYQLWNQQKRFWRKPTRWRRGSLQHKQFFWMISCRWDHQKGWKLLKYKKIKICSEK